MSTIPWEIDLLGPLCVRREGHTITRFKTRKTGALLGLMAVHSTRPYLRDEIISLLWPDADDDSGRNRLRLALSDLRRHLDDFVEEQNRVIVADRLQVQLNVKVFTTDKQRFETLLQLSARADEEAYNIDCLTQAVELYRGDLLEGLEEDWITGERQQLADSYLLALRRLIKALAKTHQYDRALSYAHRAVQADPFREESHRVLMQLYAAIGRPADALRQFRQMEQLLHNELKVAPSASSQRLRDQLLMPAPPTSTTASVAPTEPAPAPTTAPSSLLCLAPVMQVPSVETKPGQLPVYGTPLLGRQAEVEQICKLLLTPDTRLVTLTGLGGCGKTRVAVQTGHALRALFAERIWFVSLAALQDAGLLWEAIADALGLSNEPTVDRRQQVSRALEGSTGLLILDNAEHLGEAASMRIATLLNAAPLLSCLVTSRQRLNLSCEYEISLSPLPVPLSDAPLPDLLTCPSVQLFVERARRVRASFQITPANAPLLAELCRRLEGLPLSLELAAVWVQTLTLTQVLSRLEKRFDLLVSRHYDVAAHHRSLHAVLDGSFQLLEAPVQSFFSQLSVFRGGWSLEAAQTITETPEALEYLTQLRERSLLTVEETGDQMRFRWLETVRIFAEGLLTTLARETLAQRHAQWFYALTDKSQPALHGNQVTVALAEIEQEQENLRAAILWGMAHPPLGAQMANSLVDFWYIRGRLEEASSWLTQALSKDMALPSEVRLTTTGNAGNFAYVRGDYQTATIHFQTCLTMAQQMGDALSIAHALDSLGSIAEKEGSLDKARALLDESIRHWQQLDSPRYLALAISHRAGLAEQEGDARHARRLYEESLALYRSIDKQVSVSLLLSDLARVLITDGNYAASLPLLAESLMLSQRIGSPLNLLLALCQAARLTVHKRQFTHTARLLGQIADVRAKAQITLNPITEAELEQIQEAVTQALPLADFQEFWRQGKAEALEVLVDELNS